MFKIATPAAALRARITSIKARGFRASYREDGAIDLASIIIGVVVAAIVGAIIAGSVLIAIPWSQNQQTKGNIGAAGEAEDLWLKFSVSATSNGDYATEAQLQSTAITAANDTGKPLIPAGANNMAIVASAVNAPLDWYIIGGVSATGAGTTKFYTFSDSNKIYDAAAAAAYRSGAFVAAYPLATALPTVTLGTD